MSSSNSESSDCEQESQPGPSIKRKIKCNQKSKFSKEWTKTWPFIMAVPGLLMYSMLYESVLLTRECVMCMKDHFSSQ